MGRPLVEAATILATSAGLALVVNGLRPDGLPLVATRPYQIVVPCPEPGGPVRGVEAHDPVVVDPHTFLLDARDPREYSEWHLPGAVNVRYDWLDPLPEAALEELARAIASSRARVVAVYGDGGRPDSGEYLGREISGHGIRNVCYVVGGADALRGGGKP